MGLHANNGPRKFEFICASQDLTLEEALKQSNLNIKLFRPPSDKELKDFYSHCDIFLSLSISEGFSLPALEAMALGCIVLTTNSGGVGDFAVHKMNSIVLNERSALLAVDLILDVLGDPKRVNSISHEAINTAQRFTHERFSRNYLSYFMEQAL